MILLMRWIYKRFWSTRMQAENKNIRLQYLQKFVKFSNHDILYNFFGIICSSLQITRYSYEQNSHQGQFKKQNCK